MSVHKQGWDISKMNLVFFQEVFLEDLVPVLALLQVQVLIHNWGRNLQTMEDL